MSNKLSGEGPRSSDNISDWGKKLNCRVQTAGITIGTQLMISAT